MEILGSAGFSFGLPAMRRVREGGVTELLISSLLHAIGWPTSGIGLMEEEYARR